MQTREYGNTGEQLSIIGFGGIMVSKVSTEEAAKQVAHAIDRGVNYFDVAPTYGNAQEMLGPALAPYRKDVFLACKTTERTAEGARRELDESLRLMQTDHFDVYQMHSLNTDEDFDTVMAAGGALEVFREAKEKGQARYLGFSSHSAETALRLIDAVDFDSVLFPINWSTWMVAGFGPQVVDAATAKGMGVLALKGMAFGKIAEGTERVYSKCWYQPIEDRDLAQLALRFTLSQPITAALPPGEPVFYDTALDVGDAFTPLTEDEVAELQRRGAESTPIFELAAA